MVHLDVGGNGDMVRILRLPFYLGICMLIDRRLLTNTQVSSIPR